MYRWWLSRIREVTKKKEHGEWGTPAGNALIQLGCLIMLIPVFIMLLIFLFGACAALFDPDTWDDSYYSITVR